MTSVLSLVLIDPQVDFLNDDPAVATMTGE